MCVRLQESFQAYSFTLQYENTVDISKLCGTEHETN